MDLHQTRLEVAGRVGSACLGCRAGCCLGILRAQHHSQHGLLSLTSACSMVHQIHICWESISIYHQCLPKLLQFLILARFLLLAAHLCCARCGSRLRRKDILDHCS